MISHKKSRDPNTLKAAVKVDSLVWVVKLEAELEVVELRRVGVPVELLLKWALICWLRSIVRLRPTYLLRPLLPTLDVDAILADGVKIFSGVLPRSIDPIG